MNELLQLAGLWEDAYSKNDTFHMKDIEKCIIGNFTNFWVEVFFEYIIGRKQRDVNFFIQVAADNDINRLTRIKGIGIKTAEAMIEAFRDPEILEMVRQLRESGLNFREE